MNDVVKDGGIRHPVLNSIYESPLTAAVMSKLVAQPTNINSSGIRGPKDAAEASQAEFYQASAQFQSNMRDQENALELFPDIEMTKQTIISLILAPNTMTQEDLVYRVGHSLVPPDLANKIIELMRDQIESHYRLQEKLFKIIEDAMFRVGAHARMVLPESAVDHLINNRPGLRVESQSDASRIFRTIESGGHGFLGPAITGNIRSESEFGGIRFNDSIPCNEKGEEILGNVEVSDNFGLLKEPLFQKSIRKEFVRGKIRNFQRGVGDPTVRTAEDSVEQMVRVESFSPMGRRTPTDEELRAALYKSSNGKSELFLRIPEADNLRRHSVGRPLDMVIPAEAMIMAHYPGEPERALGAFVLVGPDGYFLNAESQRRSMINANGHITNSINATTNSNGKDSLSTNLLERARQGLKSADNTTPLMYLAETIGPLVDDYFIRRLSNGIEGTEVALSRNQDIYMVMIARSLAGQNTQIIYLPKEFFTYFAFQYNANGSGRSHLADVKYLISLRGVSLFAKVANQVRNAISITNINLELDPRDPTPQRTIEKVLDLSAQGRAQFFPWGLNTPSDLANWWHRAGFQMHVTGHKGIPATKIEYETKAHDKNVPDLHDDETLNDMIHMHFGITPEMRDSSKGAQFATSIANQNILLTKRVMQLQTTFNSLLCDYCRVIANNDSFITNKIRKLISESWGEIATQFSDTLKIFAEQDRENAIDYFLNEVIDTIEVKLPKPNVTSVRNQLEAFQAFKDAVEETFDFIMSDDAISQAVLGEKAEAIVAMRTPLKAQIYRDWMRRENFMPELLELMESKGEGKESTVSPIVNQVKEDLTNLSKNVIDLMASMKAVSVATAQDIDRLKPQEEETY